MKTIRRSLLLLGVGAVVLVGLTRDKIEKESRQFIWLMTAPQGGLHDEDLADMWSERAHEYIHGKDATGALLSFANALEFDDQQPKYMQDLATCMVVFRKDAEKMYHLNQQQVFDRVAALYETALKQSPRDFDLAQDYANTFYLMKPVRLEFARKAWGTALNNARSDFEREEVEMHLARIDIQEGLFDSANSRLLLVMHDDNQALREVLFRRLVRERQQFPKRVAPLVKST